MSGIDRQTSESFESLDLAKASDAELAEFARHHGVEVERLERCRDYLRTAAPFHGSFELLALVRSDEPDAEPALVVRLVRDADTWVELPAGFPSEHFLAILELLHDI